ncbi:pyridoxal phosphate-dependent aminotransferase [Herbiconiux sp. L3-i23]|nr:pyridoxal phosphate-dependent aminotransferase [Herbiconiux sp. L3-i23]
MKPAPHAATVPASGIREIVDLAMQAATPVRRLEIGEPDFPTPAHIVEAAFDAARVSTSYVQSAGMPVLRNAIIERLGERYGLDLALPEVVVSQGAVGAVSALISIVAGPGDEVLIPDPAWPNYEMQALLAGATPTFYPLRPEAGFLPDVAEIEALLTPRTRAIVINSPGNPTGAVMPRSDVERVVALAAARDILVISDEVYDEILFDGEPANAAGFDRDHVASVFSFSKTYAMTGWRVGYSVIPRSLSAPFASVLETTLSCVSSVTQAAALAAITGPQDQVAAMRTAYRRRRDLAVGLLREAGLDIGTPAGAFYLMIPLADGADSRAAALDLVRQGVALAPGSAFGANAPHHLRMSLAAHDDDIAAGVRTFLDWRAATDGGLRVARAGSAG